LKTAHRPLQDSTAQPAQTDCFGAEKSVSTWSGDMMLERNAAIGVWPFRHHSSKAEK
jgi:hypothetical protein